MASCCCKHHCSYPTTQHKKSIRAQTLVAIIWILPQLQGEAGNDDNGNSNNKHMVEYSNAIVSSDSSCCWRLEPEEASVSSFIIVVHFADHVCNRTTIFGLYPLDLSKSSQPLARSVCLFYVMESRDL